MEWDDSAIRAFLRSTAEFNRHLCLLAFLLPTISTRVTEFLDNKYVNDLRRRNLYAVYGDMFNLTIYHKGTNQSGYDRCIPAFYPDVLRELMVEYLAGGCRTNKVFLSEQAYGPQASALYAK
jgi:hypothetical protein